MRGYVSILTPNVGDVIPSVARTRLVGPNDGVTSFAATQSGNGAGMNNGSKKMMKDSRPATNSKDDHYCGLNANECLRK